MGGSHAISKCAHGKSAGYSQSISKMFNVSVCTTRAQWEVSVRRTHDPWRRAVHLRARSELLLAHMAPACPPLLCRLVIPRPAHVLSFQKQPKSHKHDKKFVSSLHSLSITFSFSLRL